MRILLDLQGCQTESRLRGIGRYSFALTEAFLKQAQKHDVWILLNRQLPAVEELRYLLKSRVPEDQIIAFDVPANCAWGSEKNRWRRQVAELIREQFIRFIEPDVIHISSLFEGLFNEDAVTSVSRLNSKTLTVVTLYDLIPLLSPEMYLVTEQHRQGYFDKVNSLRKADLLLSISEYSRQEAIEHLGIAPEKIINISSAQNDQFKPIEDPNTGQEVLNRLKIDRPFVMYNGAFDPRKNIDRLVESYALLPAEIRKRYQLILVGKVSRPYQLKLEQLARKLKIEDSLVFTNYVNDHDLLSLFQRATVFIFPSLHEGFGLPALEAMSCGIPTIGSNVTSIPEVIGREDALFNPLDPKDMAAKLTEALTNEYFQQQLKVHALETAKQFSWERSAKTTLEAIESLLKNNATSNSEPFHSWEQQQQDWDDQYRELVTQIAQIPTYDDAPNQQDLVITAACLASNQAQMQLIARAHVLPDTLHWRIEGPFDSSYSLALLNRETARALSNLGHIVSLHSTEGPGDFLPSPDFLAANPDLEKMYGRSLITRSIHDDVTSRNLYPPRVEDMDCRLNLLHHYAWEESGFPAQWVEQFNQYLQGITCLSTHVQKILVDSGVNVPLRVSGCGVDHWDRVLACPDYQVTGKSFRFLHVSSCFPRKGVQVLLEAFGNAFNSSDDVCLIIKTFPNPHNQIHQWLQQARLQFDAFPDVQIIEEDLSPEQLKSLYQQCHVLVAPSFAEGFGLPLAEAMLTGLTVITTGWGGQRDFCNSDTALLVDYSFEQTQTHFKLFDSVWAVPKVSHLSALMQESRSESTAVRQARLLKAKALLYQEFTWQAVAQRLVGAARDWSLRRKKANPKIGWVSTWQTRCGIASYSENLLQEMPCDALIFAPRIDGLSNTPSQDDRFKMVRCWDAGDHGNSLLPLAQALKEHPVDILVIQFQYSFFEISEFGRFLAEQLDTGQKIVLMMHSTSDPVEVLPHQRLYKIVEQLKRCQRILVHSVSDLNRLKDLELVDNVALFPHGILDAPTASASTKKSALMNDAGKAVPQHHYFELASYGFFLPHKGLLELIDAINLLRVRGCDVRLHMVNAAYPAAVSAGLISAAKKKIQSLGLGPYISLTTDYLENNASLALLAKADLIVFPYQETGESSSAAVRTGLASGKPVAVTPLGIFEDVAMAVQVLPGLSPAEIADGIQNLMIALREAPENSAVNLAEAARWCDAHRYRHLGPRLYCILQALTQLDKP